MSVIQTFRSQVWISDTFQANFFSVSCWWYHFQCSTMVWLIEFKVMKKCRKTMLCKCHLFRLLISRCKKRINGQLKKWLTAHCASKHMLNHFRQTIYTKWSVKNEVLLLFSFFFSMALQRSYNHTAVLF